MDGIEFHIRLLVEGVDLWPAAGCCLPHQGDAGVHLMGPAGQEGEHIQRFRLICGFAQDLIPVDHNGVRADHRAVFRLQALIDFQSLLGGQFRHNVRGTGFGNGFLHLRRNHLKRESCLSHQFFSSGRGRRQNVFHGFCVLSFAFSCSLYHKL